MNRSSCPRGDLHRGWFATLLVGAVFLGACGDGASAAKPRDSEIPDASPVDGVLVVADSGAAETLAVDGEREGDPFAQRIVAFTPGEFAGFGQDKLPGVVLGAPRGGGANAGSLDVLSLGKLGCIVLDISPGQIVDGEGPDLLVFENPFGTYFETGIVGVSADGETWKDFPCAATDAVGGYPGCAGTHYVYASPGNGIDPTVPALAGGDPFDLRDLGMASARFVRICDSGLNAYAGVAGGFDLDGVAVVHGRAVAP